MEVCPTTRCISAEQTPHHKCTCTKTKGQASSRPLLLEDTVPSTSTVPLHQDAHIHTSTHWCEGSKGDNPWPWLASAGHQISSFDSSLSYKLSQILIQAFLHAQRGCGISTLGDIQNLTGGGPGRPAVGDPVSSLEIPANLTYPTEVLPTQLPALTTCHYSRGAIWAVPPWGTDFFHPSPKAD